MNKIKAACVVSFVLVLVLKFGSYSIGMTLEKSGCRLCSTALWSVGSYLGNGFSSGQLGLIYWIGDGVEKDLKFAKRLLIKGIKADGDIRPFLYALADIEEFENNPQKSQLIFKDLCLDDLAEACQRVK